jgi:hypothetical protein
MKDGEKDLMVTFFTRTVFFMNSYVYSEFPTMKLSSPAGIISAFFIPCVDNEKLMDTLRINSRLISTYTIMALHYSLSCIHITDYFVREIK